MDLELIIANRNYSSWSLRGYLALARAGLPFRETIIPLGQPDSLERLKSKSPSARVPALRDGDLLIWDSLAIAEYAAELAPAAQLWPADRGVRAVARSVCAEMHSGYAALRQNMPMNLRARKPGAGHTPEALADAAQIQERWRHLRERYGAGGEFLFGAFSIADCFFAPVVTRFETYGVEQDPVARRYGDAIRSVPELQRWLAAALEEPWRMPQYD